MNAKARHRRGECPGSFLRHALCILLCLLSRYAGLQPPDHSVRPGSVLYEIAPGKAHRQPQFAAVQLPWDQRKLELPRHYADNAIWFAIQQKGLAKDLRFAVQPVAPHLVADYDDLLPALILLLGKGSSHQRLDTQRREYGCSQAGAIDLRGLSYALQFETVFLVNAQVQKPVCITFISRNFGTRYQQISTP
jgi:hypothetical protein